MIARLPRPAAIVAILAGGEGRRLGGITKALLSIDGRPLWRWAIDALAHQGLGCVLSVAAGSAAAAWVIESGVPSVIDAVPDGGPLAGIAAAIDWARTACPEANTVVSVPVDVPFVPPDLVARLTAAAPLDGIAVAESAGRQHHAIAAWPITCRDQLATAISGGEAAVHRFQARVETTTVHWPAEPFDPFFNINTPDDLRAAEGLASRVAAVSSRSFA